MTADDKGEVVLGLGFMTMGENSHEVTWGLKNKLDDVQPTLPARVKAVPVYDRTELGMLTIWRTVQLLSSGPWCGLRIGGV